MEGVSSSCSAPGSLKGELERAAAGACGLFILVPGSWVWEEAAVVSVCECGRADLPLAKPRPLKTFGCLLSNVPQIVSRKRPLLGMLNRFSAQNRSHGSERSVKCSFEHN